MRRKLLVIAGLVLLYWAGYSYKQDTAIAPSIARSGDDQGQVAQAQGSVFRSPRQLIEKPRLAANPYARINPPNPLRWFSSEEIDQLTDEVSLLPLVFDDDKRDIAIEIAHALDSTLAQAWCSDFLREPKEGEQVISVYPILSVEVESIDGVGKISVLDLEVLPDIIPSLASDCIRDTLDGHQFESVRGPYSYRIKHVVQYWGFFADLKDPRWPH